MNPRKQQETLIFEVTASGFPVATLLSGDGEQLKRDFRAKLLDKFAQLDRVVGDVLRGELVLPGFTLSEVHEVYPVLVVLANFPQFPTIWSAFQAIMDSEGLFAFSDRPALVTPVHVVTVEELEIIEPMFAMRQIEWPKLLADWAVDPMFRGISLKNYLLRGPVDLKDNPSMRKLFDTYREQMLVRARALGLAS